MCLFGIGSGISPNVTFALVIDRAQLSGYGTASTLWNLAYDAGDEADPAAFGVFMACTSYPATFALAGILMLAALVPAMYDGAAGGHDSRRGRRRCSGRGHRRQPRSR